MNIISLGKIHWKQRCFLIGNGPSLNQTDLTLLKNEYTFGVNKIYQLFDKMGFVPTYYVVIDEKDAEYDKEEIRNIKGTTKIFPCAFEPLFPNETYFKWCGGGTFSPDASKGLDSGENVMYICMQLAYYMGFRKVYLVGMDFDWGEELQDIRPHQTIIGHDQKTHFSPNYRKPNELWVAPDLEEALKGFTKAKDYFEKPHGEYREELGKIYNATIGGKLEIFPRVNYQDIIGGKNEIFTRN